jgi:DNA (cytosine-5)-methyltransferase 1
LGYSTDVLAVDARHFVPQSRPRMFIVGIRGDLPDGAVRGVPPISDTRPEWVRKIHGRHAAEMMHYLPLPTLPDGPSDLAGVVERLPSTDSRWWGPDRLIAFVESLSLTQSARVAMLQDASEISWRTAYRRTRDGVAVWELRRDGIGGCLRTTGGGSSKQALVELGKGEIRVRWMTPLEYARLMGAGDYKLQAGTPNQALFGFGDAVVVDVIEWIGRHYLLPALRPSRVLVAA